MIVFLPRQKVLLNTGEVASVTRNTYGGVTLSLKNGNDVSVDDVEGSFMEDLGAALASHIEVPSGVAIGPSS